MENWDGGHETMGISIPERECFFKEDRSPKQLFVNVARKEKNISKRGKRWGKQK
jgi:hypothetical protein